MSCHAMWHHAGAEGAQALVRWWRPPEDCELREGGAYLVTDLQAGGARRIGSGEQGGGRGSLSSPSSSQSGLLELTASRSTT